MTNTQPIALATPTEDHPNHGEPREVHPGDGSDGWIATIREVLGYDAMTGPDYGSFTMVDIESLEVYEFETLTGESLSLETVVQKARDAAQ